MSNDFDDQDIFESEADNTTAKAYGSLFAAFGLIFLFLYILSAIQNSMGLLESLKKMEDEHQKHLHELESTKSEHAQKLSALQEQYEQKLQLYEVQASNYLGSLAQTDEKKNYETLLAQVDELLDANKESIDIVKIELEKIELKKKELFALREQVKVLIESNLVIKDQLRQLTPQQAAKPSMIPNTPKRLPASQGKGENQLDKVEEVNILEPPQRIPTTQQGGL